MKTDLNSNEKELVINGYLMSLAVFVTTMPIPIINLLANLYYCISYRKSEYVVRWHAYNSFLSQVPLFFINSFTWCVVWKVLWSEWTLSLWIITYLVIAFLLNAGEIISSVICCIRVSRNKEVKVPFISPLTDVLVEKKSWNRWKNGWEDVSQLHEENAVASRNKILNDFAWCTFFISVIFILIFGIGTKQQWNIPKFSIESLLEKLMIQDIESKQMTDEQCIEPLKNMAATICEKNGLDSVNIYLVKNEEVNAYAFSGRNVVVYTGLIKDCEKENELMAVLGHEIAHVEKKHVIKSIKRNVGIRVLLSAFLGNYADITTMLSMNYLSKENEIEADLLSVEYMSNAGFDPSGLVDFLKRTSDEKLDKMNILSDHPTTQKRITKLNEKIKHVGQKQYGTLLSSEEWVNFKNKVKDLPY